MNFAGEVGEVAQRAIRKGGLFCGLAPACGGGLSIKFPRGNLILAPARVWVGVYKNCSDVRTISGSRARVGGSFTVKDLSAEPGSRARVGIIEKSKANPSEPKRTQSEPGSPAEAQKANRTEPRPLRTGSGSLGPGGDFDQEREIGPNQSENLNPGTFEPTGTDGEGWEDI